MGFNDVDLEAAESASDKNAVGGDLASSVRTATIEETAANKLREKYAFLRTLHRWEEWLSRHFGVEESGAERVPPDQRSAPNLITMMTFWFAINVNPSTLIIGIIGVSYGLSVNETILIGLVSSLVAALGPAFCATLAPSTGLRQIAISRFTFGIWGSKINAFVNIVIELGFSVVMGIIGGQMVSALSDGVVPVWAGIIIMCFLAWFLSILGLRHIHWYMEYSWIIILVIFCVLFGLARPSFVSDPWLRYSDGLAHSGGVLDYFAVVFGGGIAWVTLAGDYYVHYPADTSKTKIFLYTYLGLILPFGLTYVLGAELGGVYMENTDFQALYTEYSIAGIVDFIIPSYGAAKFVSVLFFLSFISQKAVTVYSTGISIQLLSEYLLVIPHFIWGTLSTIIILVLSIAGESVLYAIISNLTAILGYWALLFVGCIALEHFIFRPRLGGYDAENWLDPKILPLGIAGIITMWVCYALTFLGMAQTWFTGPLAKLFGPYGGDVAVYIVIVACPILYIPLRAWEIKRFGR
ncbi:permease for cytosine/purines, uracil, thiamine, allantoin-domain-containing protein [Xylariales sp. PMI_506]|nr:permease for cytosine/purines, uracil, thiamine, allantoin-domain-containing protein [Xylariales sp. PMI_506]